MSELRTNRIVPRDGLPSGSAGGIIQVKNTTKTDPWTHPSPYTSYAQVTGLDVTITPTRSDSKILVTASVNYTTAHWQGCLLYTSPSPRDQRGSRMPSSA